MTIAEKAGLVLFLAVLSMTDWAVADANGYEVVVACIGALFFILGHFINEEAIPS